MRILTQGKDGNLKNKNPVLGKDTLATPVYDWLLLNKDETS